MNYKQQIEEILKMTADRDTAEAMISVATSIRLFFFTLCDGGMSRQEALTLSCTYLENMINLNRRPGDA